MRKVNTDCDNQKIMDVDSSWFFLSFLLFFVEFWGKKTQNNQNICVLLTERLFQKTQFMIGFSNRPAFCSLWLTFAPWLSSSSVHMGDWPFYQTVSPAISYLHFPLKRKFGVFTAQFLTSLPSQCVALLHSGVTVGCREGQPCIALVWMILIERDKYVICP